MPNNNDLGKHYKVDEARSETRRVHGEMSFDRALGTEPGPQSPATSPPAERVVTPPKKSSSAGKGGLAE